MSAVTLIHTAGIDATVDDRGKIRTACGRIIREYALVHKPRYFEYCKVCHPGKTAKATRKLHRLPQYYYNHNIPVEGPTKARCGHVVTPEHFTVESEATSIWCTQGCF